MLYVLCGPSGSGKTTFLKLLTSKFSDLRVIPVYVFRDKVRPLVEIGKIECNKDEFINLKNDFDHLLQYNNDIYAFKLPLDTKMEKSFYVIDYPGEYPDCIEFQKTNWKGILILPLNETQLQNRLSKCDRQNRISSSKNEFNECINEINQNVYNSLKWKVIINDSFSDLENYIENIKTVANIV